jgi:tetratricopeptide (TPR) repeat protein
LKEILANFDASVHPKHQADDFQILLTSDKLSEGVNLNRAGAIINYDIPWNPTRVIQRVGRINRIGKKVFQNLYIYNFFPTEQGADIIKSREIASEKMFLIHNTLGEDAKIFAVDETPSPAELFKRVNTNPEDEQDQSTLTQVRRLFFDIQNNYPELVERINDFPPRVKTAKAFSDNQLLVFRRKGLGLFIQCVDDTSQEKPEVRSPLFDDTLPLIECTFDEPRLELSPNFWDSYEAIKAYREVQHVPKSEAALETKAFNNLQTALFAYKAEFEEYLPFIRILIEDLRDYKTLAKSTLRRFAGIKLDASNPKSMSDFKAELKAVKINLGEDYLDIVKKRLGSLKSEVIIAILWLGDQATLTFITAGVGVIVVVFVLIWMGFSKRTLYLKVSFPIEAKTPETYPRYSLRIRRIAWISLVTLFLSGMVGVYFLERHRQALTDKLVILIVAFEGPEEVYGLRNEIIENLNVDFSDDQGIEITIVDEVITLTRGSDYARRLGKRFLADIVIWGWYRPTENPNITIHIENLTPNQLVPLNESTTLKPSTTLAELESFTFQQQAGQETSALISFLAGFIEYQANKYEDAIFYFDVSLKDFEDRSEIFNKQADVYFYRANSKYSIGKIDLALEDYNSALEINSDRASIYNNRGLAFYKLEQYEYAIQDFDKAIDLNPKNSTAYNSRGATYHDLGQYERAIQDFDKAIEFDPKYTNAYNNRGIAYRNLGKYERAVQEFDKAIELDPNRIAAYFNRGTAYHGLEQYERAFQDFNKAIELDPNSAPAYYTRGLAYHDLGQYEPAFHDYDKAIELNPNFALAYYGRGTAYQNLEQYERAIQDFDKAIELDPNYEPAYYTRGHAYSNLGLYESAIQDYDKAIELDPNYADTYYNRGIAFSNLGQYERAIQDFDKAIELDPNSAPVYNDRGIAFHDLKQYELAVRDFNKAIDLDPNYVEAYNNRGNAYSDLGQYEHAIQDFDKAIELVLKDAVAYYNRGNAYRNLEQYELALQDYNKAIELNQSYAFAYINRGIVYGHLEQYEHAIQDFDKAIEINPRDADVYVNRGNAFYFKGQYESAIQDYNKAIELRLNFAYAYYNRGLAYQALGKNVEAETDFKKYEELTGEKP